jgi:hypothetical protein
VKLGKKKFFYIGLIFLAVVLIAYGLLRSKFGPFLPESIDKNLPNAVMFAAVGIMLWNRKILGDERKAAAARKLEEEEAEAARQAEAAGEEKGGEGGEIGTDAEG